MIFADMIPQKDGINFISSQDKNNGVVAKVQECEGIKKYPAGIITVPLKGSVLMAHLQPEPCYVAHQIAVLTPRKPMTKQAKLFYCLCIQKNAYRFNYGRQADKTLKNLVLPDSLPEWVNTSRTAFNVRLFLQSAPRFRMERLYNERFISFCQR